MTDLSSIESVVRWAKGTDLAEISYKRGGHGVEFRLEGAPIRSALPSCSMLPVCSPSVGIYRASREGSAASFEKGRRVGAGEPLGLIEVGARSECVRAPASGRLAAVLIEDGKPVEYGQALFFIEP
jgi:biotin carboxyl carrier protein